MKTFILLFLISIPIFQMRSQSNTDLKTRHLHNKSTSQASIDSDEILPVQKTKKENNIQTSTIFSDSRNGFGTLIEETNPLHYNQDLNMIAFTQRLPTTISWPTTGLPLTDQKGFIVTKYSTDNGATWDGVCYFQDTVAWSRYPSGVIANAPGNTDPAEARFVAMGPCTNVSSNWAYNWFASIPTNTTGNITTNDQQVSPTSLDSLTSISQGVYFSSYNTISNGTTVWTAGRQVDANGKLRGVVIYKGTRGLTVSDPYTWTVHTTTFNNWKINSFGTYYCSIPKIAFAPDGLTGYILINGIRADETGDVAKTLHPIIWKTTDAGLTWNRINQNYDWNLQHPEIKCNLSSTSNDEDWSPMGVNQTYPAFFDAHGSGITVDNTGKLHYVTTIAPAYSSHTDSSFYIYGQYGFSYEQNDDLTKPWIYDLTTNGNGTWDHCQIGKLWTRNIEKDDITPDPAPWTTDGTAPMDYSNRIRISRSNDGTKIFYSWTDGDTTSLVTGPPDTYHANTNPNLEYKGYDVASDLFSVTKEMSAADADEGGYYNHYTSPVSMPTANGYRIPAVYISSQDGNQNAGNPVNYNYISDMEIVNNEYSVDLPMNFIQAWGTYCGWIFNLSEEVGSSISTVTQNFPNPFSNSSIAKVNLNKAENISLNVTNSLGQQVATQTVKGNAGVNELTIDATNLSNGLYFYSVSAGNSKVTRKMTIVK